MHDTDIQRATNAVEHSSGAEILKREGRREKAETPLQIDFTLTFIGALFDLQPRELTYLQRHMNFGSLCLLVHL